MSQYWLVSNPRTRRCGLGPRSTCGGGRDGRPSSRHGSQDAAILKKLAKPTPLKVKDLPLRGKS